jgi:NDP-sugar pyrophosphorylase family protein
VVLLSTTEFPYDVVETNSDLVKGFVQKPILDFKVNAGHYAFTKNAIEAYFPEKGNFVDLMLPKMAQDRRLYSHEFLGEWVTINNIKQLERAKHRLHSILH